MLDVLEKIDEGAGIRPGEEVLVILDALRNSVQESLDSSATSKKVFSLPPRLYIHRTNSEHLNFVPECKYVLQNILFEYSNILVEYSYVFHVSNFRTKLKYRL